jgi:hypothetical protein
MNAHDILMYGDSFVMRNLVDLPMEHWETDGVCGWWGVKQIIAHLASFEHVLTEVFRSFLDGGETPYLDRMAAIGPGPWNDAMIAERMGLTPAETLAEYQQAQAENLRLVARLPAETLREVGTLPWYGREYALDDYLVYQFYGHKREHTSQINVFKDTFNPDATKRPAA